MTYPNYPQQQPQYPPQQPYSPYPPQQPGYPQPSYPPSQYPQQPGYPPQQPQQAHGTIDDFYDQPAASGKSISSWFQTPGQSITGMVARALTNADTRPQTDMQTKQPRYYSDGTPMRTLTIPLLVQPSPDFPDGRAAWIINASDREDLDVAMQAAGCKPRTVPEAGAVITVTFSGLKQIPGFGVPKKMKTVTYQRPQGAGQAAANPTTQTPYATAPAPGPAPATPAPPATAGYPPPLPNYNPQPAFAGQQPQVQYPDPTYAAPAGAAPGQAPVPAPATAGAPQGYPMTAQATTPPMAPPVTAYGQDPYAMATGQPQPAVQPQFQPPQYQAAPVPPTPGAAAAPPASTPGAPPTAPASPSSGYVVPGGLSAEQEERLRQLTGGQ